jgi:hypothetical protein
MLHQFITLAGLLQPGAGYGTTPQDYTAWYAALRTTTSPSPNTLAHRRGTQAGQEYPGRPAAFVGEEGIDGPVHRLGYPGSAVHLARQPDQPHWTR